MQNDSIEHQGIQLSRQQLLMWTGQQLEPNRPIYNMGFCIEIPVAIDEAAFVKALEQVVKESDSHRSVIRMLHGEPQILVREHIEFKPDVLDYLKADDPERRARLWCQQRCEQIFDLSERMFDCALLRVASDKYIWFTNHHHIISDAWSSTQLLRLQSKAYEAISNGQDPGELKCEVESTTAASLDSLQSSLATFTEFFGRKPERALSCSTRIEVLSEGDELGGQLERLINDDQAKSFSPELGRFNVLMTLLLALLNRVSGRRDLCIGVPFHNRLTPQQKRSLGLFISLHPYRVELEPGETFRSLFDKVKIASNDYLKSAASGQQSGSNNKYNVIFNFINARFGEFAGTGVRAQWLHPGCHDRQHHLRMHVEGFGDQWAIKFDLNQDVFGERKREEVVRHFKKLVRAFASDWEQVLETVDLANVQKEIAAQLGPEGQAGISKELIPDLFCKRMEQSPDQVAVEYDGQRLTNSQFSQLVDRIAGQLANVDGRPRRIAICMNRSPEAVATMIAAMKTGNVFVPLDPTWPDVRLKHIVNDAEAVSVVTMSQHGLPKVLDKLRINVDELKDGQTEIELTEVCESDPAYVLYTSGSTGKPKGVEISHASIAHYVNWAVSFYAQGNPVSFPLFTPLTFDLTLTSIFVPLLSGGRIVIYRERQGGHDTSLLQVLEDDLVDVVKLTPSHLSLLAGQNFQNSRVRQLILGGEDLSSDLVRQTFSVFAPGLKIHNEYGPTEATVGCVVQTIDAQSHFEGVSVPIGSPIPGTSALVVNDALGIQPDGVAGELCILGIGLANGYLNQAELTNEKFVSLSAAGGARAYRTGDIARWNEQGQLEYLGRDDNQVKIRGARIELKSVEAAIREHAAIGEVVVASYLPPAVNDLIANCTRCGLASNFPGTEFDSNGVCNQCRSFDAYVENASAYFRSMEDLQQILSDRKNGKSSHDCLALLSGGKDSSYMLARLAELDLRVLAFTLDNGYISDEAKANIRRVTEALGVEHVFGTTPHMNRIFVDSLKRFSNVCQGCFKTIYTLAMNLALENQIPYIVTGLSRGQLFETRLTEEFFREPCDNLVQIDQSVLDARKAYHRVPDAVSEYLNVEALQTDESFEKVQFIDFYRFCDVTLEEMLGYLKHKLPWIRPADTGRSTNCLINDVGIYVHKRNEGFHNYTMPYSWDVRMGHKTRDEAVEELVDQIDVAGVHKILDEIGYDGELAPQDRSTRLIAYYTSEQPVDREELSEFLKQRIPDFMLPSRYVQIDAVPLTENGKVDASRLPDPFAASIVRQNNFKAPENELQVKLAEIWQKLLGVERIGIHDNFFDLGGDSIIAIQIVAAANQNGIRIRPAEMFESLTVKKLADRVNGDQIVQKFDLNVSQKYLSPAQYWMLEHGLGEDDYWTQSIELILPSTFKESDIDGLSRALSKIVRANPALRTAIRTNGEIIPIDRQASLELGYLDLGVQLNGKREEVVASIENDLAQKLTVSSGKLIAGHVIRCADDDFRLLLMANHLAVDAVSWQKIISDLNACHATGSEWQPETFPPFASWTELLHAKAQTDFVEQLGYWQDNLKAPSVFGSTSPNQDSRTNIGTLRLSRRLSKEETEEIENRVRSSRIRLNELLLAAFAKSVAEFSGAREFRILVEGHGRANLDAEFDYSQTIGWFTSIYPVRLSVPEAGVVEIANAIKDQIRAVPDGGIGFGALKYLNNELEVRDSLGFNRNEVIFNFLGRASEQTDAEIVVSRPLKLHRRDSVERSASMEINLLVDSILMIDVEYAKDCFESREIVEIMDAFVANLMDMAIGLSENQTATSSDFPLAKLDSRQLGDLADALKRANKQG